jgi:hypothetical protein
MIRLYEARRGAPTRGRGHPAPRRREGTLHRYVAISQGEYERATREQDSDSLSWEGPFSRQEHAYEFIENEFGVPALVVDIGIDGAREWARVEAEQGDFDAWIDRKSAVMAGLLRQGTVLGRYDTQAQQWNRRLEERSPMSGQEQQEILDPDYVIQGLYTSGYLAYAEFGFDDEATAIAEAKKLAGSRGAPYFFEGDYVRVITRDGELVWDSRGEGVEELGPRRGHRSRRR